MHLAAAVRFGDRDPGERAGEQAGQPPVPYRGAGVGGDQPAVPKPGRIPQVDVVVAADELQHCLDQDGAAASAVAGGDGHGEVPAGGKLVPDAQQPFASQRRLDPGVDREPGQQFTQCRIEAVEPPQVQLAKLGLPRGQRGDPRGGARRSRR